MANSMPYSAGASLRIWTVGVVTWRGPKYITLPWELGLFQIVILVSPVTVDVTFVGVVSFLAAVDNVAVVFVIVAVIIVQHIYICVEFLPVYSVLKTCQLYSQLSIPKPASCPLILIHCNFFHPFHKFCICDFVSPFQSFYSK